VAVRSVEPCREWQLFERAGAGPPRRLARTPRPAEARAGSGKTPPLKMADPNGLATVENQFLAMASNAGVWEGSLESFDRCAAVTAPKTGTILYVHATANDDAARLAAGQAPYVLLFTLRKTEQQRDISQTYFRGVDMAVGGRVFSSAGAMCSGARYITRGSRVFVEMNLNYRPASPPLTPSAAPIAVRVRAVTVYDGEGYFQSVSLFKERARDGECEAPPVQLPPHPCVVSCVEEDFLAPSSARAGATPDALTGRWAGTCERLGPDGLCAVGEACGRTVRVQDGVWRVRDSAGGGGADRPAEGEVRSGRKCVVLRTPVGAEHLLPLGGGVFLRAPLVIDFGSTFCLELAFLAEPDRLLSIRRVYQNGAWRQSQFGDEVKAR
jgi:hypothetical protein